MTKNAIDVNGLTCTYAGKVVLDQLSFTVPAGSTCAVIGPSGCGKTTLLQALAGLLTPVSGELRIHDRPVAGFPTNTGIILQDHALFPWLTVFDNAALGLKMKQSDPETVRSRTHLLLEELGLGEIGDRYPSEISGGQKQRAAMARSLILEPELLLLDEATSAVDALTKEQLQDLLLSVQQSKNMTLLLVTHSIEEAVFLGKQILVKKQGAIHETIQNPLFGQKNVRKEPTFYELCLKVRESLEEGARHETEKLLPL